MSSKVKLLLLIIVVSVISAGILYLSLGKRPSESTDLSITADAYYLNYNEIAGMTESSYVDGPAAKRLCEMLSGTYKEIKSLESLEDYRKDYYIAVSPVYIGRALSEVDNYTKDPNLDDAEGVIYGEVIYVFDKKKIAYYDPEPGLYRMLKRKSGSIDIKALEDLIDKNKVEEEEEIEIEEDVSPPIEDEGQFDEGIPGFSEEIEE